MSVPTSGEEYAKFIEHLRLAQESSYTLAHLTRTSANPKATAIADGWFSIGELLKRLIYQATKIAQGKLN